MNKKTIFLAILLLGAGTILRQLAENIVKRELEQQDEIVSDEAE